MKYVLASDPRNPDLYYGAPTMPTVKGMLIECRDRAEYIEHVESYEAAEQNCNTCAHLIRIKHAPQTDGMLYGRCGVGSLDLSTALHTRSDDGVMKFHPEDPMHMKCWESRRESRKG